MVIIYVGESRIEFFEVILEDFLIVKFIEKCGEGIYYIVFGVDNIEEYFEKLKEVGYCFIDEKLRIGVGGVKIVFVYLKFVIGVFLEFC